MTPSATQPDPSPPVTRLAPSPTGALHLGNARTMLINWAMARQAGWRIVMRIEDIDTPRVKQGADVQAIDDLAWLGLDWDGPIKYQRSELAPYRDALNALLERGLIYPCPMTRKEIAAAAEALSAPHGDEHELRYPGTCRPAEPLDRAALPPLLAEGDFNWRLIVPDEDVRFTDTFAGEQVMNVQASVGDFVLATKAGLPAYQLAVVVDDALAGVTQIVRGDDLLRSAARQILLYRLLGLAPLPRYTHLPLVLGPDGRRLAKRHGDTRMASYREAGVPADRVVGLIAAWSGVVPDPQPMSASEFAERFSLSKLPAGPVTMTEEDDAWLRA